MTEALAVELAEWLADLRFESIPAPVIANAQDRILDILGICVKGATAEAGVAVRAIRDAWGAGTPEASFVGESGKGSAGAAALVNGTYAHALDFDDTHLPSIVHPSAPMVPAILAEAEASAVTGADVLTALIGAYEINTRLSMAQYDDEARNSVMFDRGLHATAILGTIAAAAGCARLRGLSAEGIANAIAIAGSFGSGLIESNRMGGSIKQVHGGWAAQGAVTAASLASFGLTGPTTVLEGRFGLYRAYCGDGWNRAAVTDGLGSRWDTPSIFFKAYPCNHFTHAIVDAALRLRAAGLRPEDVARVTIGTAEPSWWTIGDPIDEKRNPRNPYHARFSAPYVFAAAVTGGGGLGLSSGDFTDASIHEPEHVRIAQVCDVTVDAECTRVFPWQFPATVQVLTHDGSRLEERVMVTRGGAERPLSHDELKVKLNGNAGAAAPAIADACASLRHAKDVSALVAALRC